jgi:hypothetical protein
LATRLRASTGATAIADEVMLKDAAAKLNRLHEADEGQKIQQK